MSTLKTNNVQVGQSVTATNNFTIYQPSSPDGTVRIGVGNSGATTADVASMSSNGNFSFNSGYGSVATAYACRAWVNFNGTGTVAIRASGNVSSITDNGTGNYTVNLATAMTDTNYAINLTADFAVGTTALPFMGTNSNGTSGSKTVSAFGIACFQPSFSLYDVPAVYVSVFR